LKGPGLHKGSQNGSQNGASGHPKSQKNEKNEHRKNTTNKTVQKVGYWLHFVLKMGLGFRGRSAQKFTPIPQILQKAPNLQKGPPGASQMTKNHDPDLPKSRKSTAKVL
jgi:hypothetical protein